MAVRIVRVVLDNALRMKAQEAVRVAVADGRLQNLKKKKVRCADCDNRATVYDHRRYAEPLNVSPVCKGHNARRGFAEDQTFKDIITGEPRTREDYLLERCKRIRVADHITSAITGKANYLTDGADRIHWHKMRLRGRAHFHREKALAYLNAEHEYRLTHGGKDLGHRKTMTGYEAKRLNVAAERDFFERLDTNKNGRLFRWCRALKLKAA